jgi:hypothetical protein
VPENEPRQLGQRIPAEAYEGLENFAVLHRASLAAVLTVLGHEAALAIAEGKTSVSWEKVARQASEITVLSRRRRPPN